MLIFDVFWNDLVWLLVFKVNVFLFFELIVDLGLGFDVLLVLLLIKFKCEVGLVLFGIEMLFFWVL